MMEKILVTYGTRPLGLRVAKLLGQAMLVEKASSDEIPSVLQETYSGIPRGTDPVFAHELLKLALDRGCQYVLPLGWEEVCALSEAAVLFEEYGIVVLCPSRDVLSEVNVLSDPASSMALHLIREGKDMLSVKEFAAAEWDGLCLVSDSEDEFVLAVI